MKKIHSAALACLLFLPFALRAQFDPITAPLEELPLALELPEGEKSKVYRARLENQGNIQPYLEEYVNLRELTLVGNDFDYGFTQIEANLGSLQHLEYLAIYNAALTQLPDEIAYAPKLHTLVLVNTNVYSLPMTMAKMPSLKKLCVDTRVGALPAMPGLQELELELYPTQDFDPAMFQSLKGLTGLKRLRIHSYQPQADEVFMALADALRSLQPLERLEISIGLSRRSFSALRPMFPPYLEVYCAELEEDDIPLLVGVKHLKTSSFRLKGETLNFPEKMVRADTVTTYFQLADLPRLKQFPVVNLEVSDVLDKEACSDALRKIRGLRSLTLSKYGNDDEMSLAGLDNLEILSMPLIEDWDNEQLVKDLGALPKLHTLEISAGPDAALAASRGGFASLKRLVIHSNPRYYSVSEETRQALRVNFPNTKVIFAE